MPARKRRIKHDDATREKIRVGVIIDRLVKHINGEIEMTATQVSAARTLLAKVLPDLQSVEAHIEQERRMITDRPMTADEWAEHYAQRAQSAQDGSETPTH